MKNKCLLNHKWGFHQVVFLMVVDEENKLQLNNIFNRMGNKNNNNSDISLFSCFIRNNVLIYSKW